MIGLILALIGLGKSVVLWRQNADNQRAAAMSDYWRTQITFLQATSGLETRIMRQLIIGMFVASIFYAPWNQAFITAGFTPLYRVIIILWEFYGPAALGIVPWYKNVSVPGDKNGDGIPDVPGPVTPTIPNLPSLPTQFDPTKEHGG